jgi:hypothetical protein
MKLPDIDKFRHDTAERLAGDRLGCMACLRSEVLTAQSAGAYLEGGWPECCGATMSLVKGAPAPDGASVKP